MLNQLLTSDLEMGSNQVPEGQFLVGYNCIKSSMYDFMYTMPVHRIPKKGGSVHITTTISTNYQANILQHSASLVEV